MSTKIYEGWRIPRGSLPGFTAGYRRIMFRGMAKWVRKLMAVNDPVKTLEFLYPGEGGKETRDNVMSKDRWRDRISLTITFAHMYLNSERQVNHMNADSAFNFWLDGRWAYIIHFPGNFYRGSNAVDRLVRSVGGEEYRYWDNIDRPRGISDREWGQRRRTWDRVCLKDWDAGRMSHVVIEGKHPFNGFYEIEDTVLGMKGIMCTFSAAIARDKLEEADKARGGHVSDKGLQRFIGVVMCWTCTCMLWEAVLIQLGPNPVTAFILALVQACCFLSLCRSYTGIGMLQKPSQCYNQIQAQPPVNQSGPLRFPEVGPYAVEDRAMTSPIPHTVIATWGEVPDTLAEVTATSSWFHFQPGQQYHFIMVASGTGKSNMLSHYYAQHYAQHQKPVFCCLEKEPAMVSWDSVPASLIKAVKDLKEQYQDIPAPAQATQQEEPRKFRGWKRPMRSDRFWRK